MDYFTTDRFYVTCAAETMNLCVRCYNYSFSSTCIDRVATQWPWLPNEYVIDHGSFINLFEKVLQLIVIYVHKCKLACLFRKSNYFSKCPIHLCSHLQTVTRKRHPNVAWWLLFLHEPTSYTDLHSEGPEKSIDSPSWGAVWPSNSVGKFSGRITDPGRLDFIQPLPGVLQRDFLWNQILGENSHSFPA